MRDFAFACDDSVVQVNFCVLNSYVSIMYIVHGSGLQLRYLAGEIEIERKRGQ